MIKDEYFLHLHISEMSPFYNSWYILELLAYCIIVLIPCYTCFMHLEKKLVKYCFGETSEIIVKRSYKNCCLTDALGDTGDDV